MNIAFLSMKISMSTRLAKIDLVTIFECDYRWYCTIDYVIVTELECFSFQW